MDKNTELQREYQNLKARLDRLKTDKTREEVLVESLKEQRDKALDEIKLLANVETVDEAEDKLAAVDSRIEELLAEAQELIDSLGVS